MKPCINCIGSLNSHIIHSISCYYCHICGGLFLKQKDLKTLLRMDHFKLNRSLLNYSNYYKSKKNTKEISTSLLNREKFCPLCIGHLRLTLSDSFHKKNSYLFCENCKSVWLNKGDIQKLRKRFLIKLLLSGGIFLFIASISSLVILFLNMPSLTINDNNHHYENKKKQRMMHSLLKKETMPMMLFSQKIIIPPNLSSSKKQAPQKEK